MAVKAPRITLGADPVRLDPDDTDYGSGTSMAVRCPDADWFIGGPGDKAAGGGALVRAGEWLPIDLGRTDRYYGWTAGATAELHTLQAGVNG